MLCKNDKTAIRRATHCWVREETDLFCVNSGCVFHLFKSIVPNMPILVALDCFVAARGN